MAHVMIKAGADNEYGAWRRWMREIGAAREVYLKHAGDDPIHAGEAASVGLMLSAAGAAGLIGLLEYRTDKKSKRDGSYCYGRCDLWVAAQRHADQWGWAFEVKRKRMTSRSTFEDMEKTFDAAWSDAGALDVGEASMRVACTLFYSKGKVSENCDDALERLFARSDWAWRISHGDKLSPLYVLFKKRLRGNRAN